ncbi:P-loop containing nucleoside triphosphate hydrolase protein [Mycena maculata]|uniref:P-loop containing nucleoside triphosphate hydrolase protein n=1 Tax=Mycena maculata TaxID=230809 RepID=A0AAD7JLE9_9AGAR|nr:P-loop containing nucleoside triphosphate hydrolase protein [Mycena maculata]
MLPATPKIFHGRDTEIEELLIALRQDSPRVAILGSGGMGKTSLATAVMHHPEVADKFQQRHFIACDAAPTLADLVYIVASHLNCESSKNSIVSTLSAGPPLLVVLDNMETPWEPVASRSEVEEFLSLLTDIPHLALMITMRGLERPGKVRWTRPFLQPLLPLSHSAARQTFIEIADVSEGIDEVLALTDYLPLAVSLVASVVSFEGTDTVLRRWKEERTTILSAGHDKRSNLEMSIAMSLSSPRMIMFPGTRDLLGVISLLPDGLLEADLMQCSLPIADVEGCKRALIRTSLVYMDQERRIKALAPVREYVCSAHPPAAECVRPLRDHLYQILMLWKSFRQLSAPECIPRIAANLGNLQSLLVWGLDDVEDASFKIRRYVLPRLPQ